MNVLASYSNMRTPPSNKSEIVFAIAGLEDLFAELFGAESLLALIRKYWKLVIIPMGEQGIIIEIPKDTCLDYDDCRGNFALPVVTRILIKFIRESIKNISKKIQDSPT